MYYLTYYFYIMLGFFLLFTGMAFSYKRDNLGKPENFFIPPLLIFIAFVVLMAVAKSSVYVVKDQCFISLENATLNNDTTTYGNAVVCEDYQVINPKTAFQFYLWAMLDFILFVVYLIKAFWVMKEWG